MSRMERLGERLAPARERFAKYAGKAVELQKKAALGAFDQVAKLQDRSESWTLERIEDAKYLPAESKKLAGTWAAFAKKNRAEIRKTAEKTYDLTEAFFARLESKPAEA